VAIDGADFFVRLIDFPTCTCGGMVIPNDDGTFSVYLNARTSHDQQLHSYNHEKNHIEHDDFYRAASIGQMEEEAG